MNSQGLEKLKDLFGLDLAGWQITQSHFLELDHGLMGTHPAIVAESKEPVIVLKKDHLKKVWDRLKPRKAKISSRMVIANTTNGTAFNLNGYLRAEIKPMHVLSSEDIDVLCQEENPFKWAPGCFDLTSEPVQEPDFTD